MKGLPILPQQGIPTQESSDVSQQYQPQTQQLSGLGKIPRQFYSQKSSVLSQTGGAQIFFSSPKLIYSHLLSKSPSLLSRPAGYLRKSCSGDLP